MFSSVSHHFGVKSGQSVGGLFDIADYIIVRLEKTNKYFIFACFKNTVLALFMDLWS